MTQDQELLRQYGEAGSESAFTELVNRYIGLVYATAARQLEDPDWARDVTQVVFTDLARKARSLSSRVVLAGWLHEATRFAAAKVVRAERRRRAREKEAMAMHAPAPESAPDWDLLSAVLDSAIGELSTIDRDAVLLRFFERRDFQAVGTALGVSEEAAKKRVSRALERLRVRLRRRGVTLTGTALAVALTGGAMQSAPAGLAISIATTSLTEASAAAATGLAFPLLQAVTMTKTKLLVIAVAAALGIPLTLLWTQNASLRHELALLGASALRAEGSPAARSGSGENGTSSDELRRRRKEHLELLSLRGRVAQLAQELRQKTGAGAQAGAEPEAAPGTNGTDSILFTAALTNRVNRGHTLVVGGWSKDGSRAYLLATPVVRPSDAGSDQWQVAIQSQLLEGPESFWGQIGWGGSRSDARRSTLAGVLTPEQVELLRTALQDTQGSEISNPSLATSPNGELVRIGWSIKDNEGPARAVGIIDVYPRIAPDGESVDMEVRPFPVSADTPIHSSMRPADTPVVPSPAP